MAAGRTSELLHRVRDAVDIVDIASDVTRLQKRGNRYLGLCPFHKEKTPSFSVDAAQGLFYCFGCGAGGDAIKLYMQHTGDDFAAALEGLARRYGIPLPDAGPERSKDQPDARAALEAAADFFKTQLGRAAAARNYLDERRISIELRQRYGLGYAPDGWQHLLDALQKRVPEAALEAAGLVGRSSKTGNLYDRFRHRLMFPISAPSGRLVGFGGRTLGDDKAKYVNTSENDAFHKGHLLYGFHQAKRSLRESGRALLVEGYFDVLGAVAAGIDWTVAGMGTALTQEQTRLLARYVDQVIVAYDGDEAGEKAFRRALPILLGAGLGVRRARFPSGHDPDSLRLEQGADAVREAIDAAEDAVGAEIDRLTPPEAQHDPQLRSEAASAVSELLRPIRDGVVRYSYGQRAAERLALPLDLLWKRTGPAPSAEVAAPGNGSQQTLVHKIEDQALGLLLAGSPIDPDELPPEEVFFDDDCRNIYRAFCALYRKGGGLCPPEVDELLPLLDTEGGAVDRMARLLLEESNPHGGDLPQTLQRLRHRWQKQRLPDLMRRIKQAEMDGDDVLLLRLLEEKEALTRSLHGL